MTEFLEWCDETEETVGDHDLSLLNAKEQGFDIGIEKVADIVPGHYASEARLARIMQRLGKPEAAKYLAEKLPTRKAARSGDIGEILATSYIEENTVWDESVNKLRWKDSREMALRGDDMLAVGLDEDYGLMFLKGECKSRAGLSTKPIEKARASLNAHDGLPNPHSLRV